MTTPVECEVSTPRRAPWHPKSASLLGEAVERLAFDPGGCWASSPDPDDVLVLERLLERIPPRLAYPLRLHLLEGLSQRHIARIVGTHQPEVCRRVRLARTRLRAVAGLEVDLTPEEVLQRLQAAHVAPVEARLVSAYWVHHTVSDSRLEAGIALGQGVTAGTAWHHLHVGTWRDISDLRDIVTATDTICSWRVGGGRPPGSRSK